MNITREEALKVLQENVKNEKMLIHSYASEVVLRAIARKLGRDEERWGLAGLLHDVDVEVTNADPKTHALEAKNILKGKVDDEIIDAITMHMKKQQGWTGLQNFSMH